MRRPNWPPASPSSAGTSRPRAVRRGAVFTCDDVEEFCGNGLCDPCTRRLVDQLLPQVLEQTRTGLWRAFTLVWTVHRYPDGRLVHLRLKHLAQAIRHALRRVNLHGHRIIAGFDVNLEEITFGGGDRYWQVHLHGLIDVGADERGVKRRLRQAFATFKDFEEAQLDRSKRVRSPAVLKPVTDVTNWTGYSIKEPSRMLDRRVHYLNPEGIKKVWRRMKPQETAVLHSLLRSIRVRDRLFVQRYTLRADGRLIPLDATVGRAERTVPPMPKPMLPIIGLRRVGANGAKDRGQTGQEGVEGNQSLSTELYVQSMLLMRRLRSMRPR